MRPTFVQRGSVLAIVAATVPGVIQGTLGLQDTASQFAMVSLGLVALLLTTVGVAWGERKPNLGAVSVVLAADFAVVLTMVWLSQGRAFLASMPLVSLVVLMLPLGVALAVTAALLISILAVLPFDPTQVLLSFGSAFVFVIVFSLIARRERYARADVERLSAELEVLAAARERNRIAREIHDSVGHYLTVANVQLEAARATEAGRDERLVRVQELLREGLGQLRQSVSLLRETLPGSQPFTTALEELVSSSNAPSLKVQLHVKGTQRPLAGAVGFTLYRAAQEALTNAQRHAAAHRVDVELEYLAERVTLQVRDDGRGPPDEGVKPGNGLHGLRERVEQVGGAVALGGAPGRGFSLSVEVPS